MQTIIKPLMWALSLSLLCCNGLSWGQEADSQSAEASAAAVQDTCQSVRDVPITRLSKTVATVLAESSYCDLVDGAGPLYRSADSTQRLELCALATDDYFRLANLSIRKKTVTGRQEAIKYACLEAEAWERPFLFVDGFEDNPAFEDCDDAGNTRDMVACAVLRTDLDSIGLNERLRKLQTTWSAPKRRAFLALAHAKNAYIAQMGASEESQYHGGTLARSTIWPELGSVDTEFVSTLETLESNHPIPRSATSVRALDTQLRKTESELAAFYSAWTPLDERPVHNKFASYRAAWRRFLRAYYPSAKPDSVDALLVQQRLDHLGGVTAK